MSRAPRAPGAGPERARTGGHGARWANVGIDQLYSHQSDALYDAFEAPTIVTTGTASGKSLCFQLPTLEVLTSDRTARALYLYPTKALAQDQARALHALRAAQADPPGDLRRRHAARRSASAIRKRSNLILTNPDMLHVGILPHHPAWGELFANLAFVVVDEAHVYRGVFGSHVANVLRRLRRVAAIHGTEPRFLLASATIANPVELAERLTGLERLQADRPATARRARAGGSRCGIRRCSTRSSASGARRCTRRPRCSRSWSSTAPGRSAS